MADLRVETWDQGVLIETRFVTIPASESNRFLLQERAIAALSANATFLAIASPTNAQIAAQVKLLTRECSTLIRLYEGLLDDTSGT